MPYEYVPAINTARVQVWQTLHGEKIMNQLHYTGDGELSEAELNALADSVIDAWNDGVGPITTTDLQFSYVVVKDMTTVESPQITKQFPSNSGGNTVGPTMPGNVAVAIKFKTAFSGRSRQGRIFLSGLSELEVTANELNSTLVDIITTNIPVLKTGPAADGFTLCVASYYSGMALELNRRGETVWTPQPRETALVTPVSTFIVEKYTDSMKSRLEGRGN